MLQPGRRYSAGTGYRYGFNGKENDNEISGQGNQYDYGFRIYNPRLGRFLSVDPLTHSYPWYTPYQFAGNKPITAIDIDGMEEWQKFLDPFTFIAPVLETQYTRDVIDGFCERAASTIQGVTDLYKLLTNITDIGSGGRSNGGLLFTPTNNPLFIEEGLNAELGVYRMFESVIKDYAGLVKKAVEGDGKAAGGLLFEGLLFFGPGEVLKVAAAVKAEVRSFKAMDEVALIINGGHSSKMIAPANEIDDVAKFTLKDVNKIGGTENCVNCAIATESYLNGAPASALDSKPKALTVLEKEFSNKFTHGLTIDDVKAMVSKPGQSGIVFGNRGQGKVGHVFNVRNQNGKISFIDGQTGTAADLSDYQNFSFLPTN